MHFEPDCIYHIYNQGNNKQRIFFSDDNYLYFLKGYRKLILPYCDTLAYCLMPNHFHFMVSTNTNSVVPVKVGSLYLSQLSNGIRVALSSYTLAINKQQRTTGSLFRQKTKSKLLENGKHDYSFFAFHYIHQNPLAAGLVKSLNDWEYSSFKDYAGLRNGSLCNKTLAHKLLDINWNNFTEETYTMFDNKKYMDGIL
ncbi:MAG TPA: hypothetical protein PLP23_15185 [Panacibacter sp.]|nr:hypothetical protein [Panacibacter sp.]